MSPRKTIVVGAGPVGSLAALYAANRGDDVELYELRSDLRDVETTPLNFTKSINLALSERGINALRSSGHPSLLDLVLNETIPMHGRMIHTRSATGALQEQSQAYDVHGRFQRSVDRGGLNVCLLNELEKMSNVKLHFQHKLTGADFRNQKAWFEVKEQVQPEGKGNDKGRAREVEVSFDLMIGSDGAHSAVRHHMMKYARVNYQQEYIDCLWCEFTMTPDESGDFRMSPDYLHIWPAGSFMFIALPSLDKSFVCTLFGPASLFSDLENGSSEELISVFDKHFPGVTDHIPKDDLQRQFKGNPHLPLINIKCSPHHFSNNVVILGDAANAIVPFYGQGMNAGLESVRVLFEKVDGAAGDLSAALLNYTSTRAEDTRAIADLALINYVEMRSSVTSPVYKMRKFIEERLDRYLPSLGWATQYSRVSFSNMRYSQVIARATHQKRILTGVFASVLTVPVGIATYYAYSLYKLRRVR